MAASEVSCIPKYLPAELAVDAARTAVNQNPVNQPAPQIGDRSSSILPPEHLAVLTQKYWGAAGVKLGVAFLEPTQNDLRTKILKYANRWNKFGNVEFVYSTTDPQIRITRGPGGYWSYLGTDILHIPPSDPTMCLEGWSMQTPESEWLRVVPHEFGHTLGFPHEHMRKAIVDRLDMQKTLDYFRRTQGWSAAMVMSQVLTPLAESSLLNAPDADETSIMTYNLPGLITKDGRPILGGGDIAPQDEAYIGRIYPKAVVPPPPIEPPRGKGLELIEDAEAKTYYVRAKPGWKFKALTDKGTEIMSADFSQLDLLADELQGYVDGAAPTTGPPDAQAAVGGTLGKIIALITAIRAKDIAAIWTALLDLLTSLGGGGDPGTISFQRQAALGGRIPWAKLIETLMKFLPLLLG